MGMAWSVEIVIGDRVRFAGEVWVVSDIRLKGKDAPYFRFENHGGSLLGNWYSWQLCDPIDRHRRTEMDGKELKEAADRLAEFARTAMQGTPAQAPAYRDAAYMKVYCGTPHTQLGDMLAVALHTLSTASLEAGCVAKLVEACELLQGFDFRLDDSPHGQEIRRRVLAALALVRGADTPPTGDKP